MNNYEKVADWIIEECDTPHREVAWLLEKLYENKKPKLTFEEAYGDVLTMLKESEVGLEKDIKNDLYGTEVYGESEVE